MIFPWMIFSILLHKIRKKVFFCFLPAFERFSLLVKSFATVAQTRLEPLSSLLRALLLTFAWVCCCKSICVLHASAITYSPLPDCNVRAEVESCRQSHCCQLKCACVCLCFSFNNFAFFAFVLLFYTYIIVDIHTYILKNTLNALEWKLWAIWKMHNFVVLLVQPCIQKAFKFTKILWD